MTGKHILLMMLIIAALVFSSSHREHALFYLQFIGQNAGPVLHAAGGTNTVSLKKTIVAFIDASLECEVF